MNKIEQYYNKFNEDKRLLTRHGQVEFNVLKKYIQECLEKFDNPKLLDIGAGTGRYSIYFSELGYDVTAVELVKHNLRVLESKNSKVKCYQMNALNLKKFEDNSFDVTLLFGPMYHLFTKQDKVKALLEAKRVTKSGGIILISYVANDYAVLIHGFRDNNILQSFQGSLIDENFHILDNEDNLYSFVTKKDIDELNNEVKLKRIKLIGVDGATDYMRKEINKMSEEVFELYQKYILTICEREELIGASSHLLDILENNKSWQNTKSLLKFVRFSRKEEKDGRQIF